VKAIRASAAAIPQRIAAVLSFCLLRSSWPLLSSIALILSVVRPEPRRRELDQMSVGVAEVEARSAPLPFRLLDDLDLVALESGFPGVQRFRRDRERHVKLSVPVVRGLWNLGGRALLE